MKNNKTIAGYHLLMILSAVDFKFHLDEEKVIREFLAEEFPFRLALDKEMEIISNLSPDQWEAHFKQQAKDFYEDSTAQEREHFMQFAKKLIKADDNVSKEEKKYFDYLLEAWGFTVMD